MLSSGLPAQAQTQTQAELQGLAACNAPEHARVLRPEAQSWPEARAVWLNAQQLYWPGATPTGRFVLARSATADVQAQPGQALQAEQTLALLPDGELPPAALPLPFKHLAAGLRLRLADGALPAAHLPDQLVLVQMDEQGRVLQATGLQVAGLLDALYAGDADDPLPLGVHIATAPHVTQWRLWAPTARAVQLCLHARPQGPAQRLLALAPEPGTGFWRAQQPQDLSGHYYTYLVDVWVPGTGLVRQRVSDPYAISLSANGRHSWVGRLDAPDTQPPGWAQAQRPAAPAANTDMAVYELHVRDFSASDVQVPAALRGKYGAFAHPRSQGMRHLRALARAGLRDVHLLPVIDLATVPEHGCTTPQVPAAAPDSPLQQTAVMAQAANDCFNWGYDPLHFNAPDGSFASRPDDGAARIREFRQMVLALHRLGLRVGMDVVYNHMSASGQQAQSVLDRIVPGYYHRLDARGQVERSTCCDNTATEHRMMARLMLDSVRLWARWHRIDSFRFDLMGHQPRAAMLQLQALLKQDNNRLIPLIGEGWNFGEVADGARFVQASQASLGGSGIATFSDRGRDALRGGGVGDDARAMVLRQGLLNGLGTAPNEAVQADPDTLAAQPAQARQAADLLRLALAGTLRSYRFVSASGQVQSGEQLVYAGQPAGYAQQPTEVVNYVENHDNHTLWDLNAFKLPLATPSAERARVQVLGIAITAVSQGVPYFHAGIDLLRSKSMDGNSYDSGDWFNRLDFSGQHHAFGSGLPPERDNRALWPLIGPRLLLPQLKATPADIQFARQAMQDWLAIRASSSLFRLTDAQQVQQRLQMHATGAQQDPGLVAAELDGQGLPGAGFARVLVLINLHPGPQDLVLPALAGQTWQLHPVHRRPQAADQRPVQAARWLTDAGRFVLPGRTVAVYVQP